MQVHSTYLRRAALIAVTAAAFAQTSFAAGPDVILGDITGVTRGTSTTGRVGTKNGFGIGTTSCNAGNAYLNWNAFSNNTASGSTDHPTIAQNMYRLKNDRFEQIGQSWVKHGFCAEQQTVCGTCSPPPSCPQPATCCVAQLGIGCSDPYSSSLNWTQTSSTGGLGSRAWVNPFTGVFPFGAGNHTGHTHDGLSHRCIVDDADLSSTLNPGARYFAEGQYVAADDSASGNQFNNASYREITVSGPAAASPFAYTISFPGSTQQRAYALTAWSGASSVNIQPAPGADGIAYLHYKVTGPVAGIYHYEYAIYNMNLDRSIREFIVPISACGTTISNIDFHAPPQHPGFANDNIPGGAGYSSTPWTADKTATTMGWSTQTLAQNPAANAIRWGTLYNFRFDSNRPPRTVTATIGFYKTGGSIQVATQGPSPLAAPGDANLDNSVNAADVAPFVAALLDPSGLSAAQLCADDINGDLTVDGADLQGFVQLLIP